MISCHGHPNWQREVTSTSYDENSNTISGIFRTTIRRASDWKEGTQTYKYTWTHTHRKTHAHRTTNTQKNKQTHRDTYTHRTTNKRTDTTNKLSRTETHSAGLRRTKRHTQNDSTSRHRHTPQLWTKKARLGPEWSLLT